MECDSGETSHKNNDVTLEACCLILGDIKQLRVEEVF